MLFEPIGNFKVGILFDEFEYVGYGDEIRRIPLAIYYPSDDTLGKTPCQYAFKELFQLRSANNVTHKTLTHCFEDVPVSSIEKKYPVVFYHCGYGGHIMENTVLCSDLASLGYVIVSVGHPGECSGIRYKDGTIRFIEKEYIDAMENPKLFEDIGPLFEAFKVTDENEDEKLIDMGRDFFAKQDCFGKRIKIWTKDNSAAADYIKKINNSEVESILNDKLDLDKGFAVTGHSFGGATAIEVCLKDSRFVCGLNMDGGNFGDNYGSDIKKPYLALGNPFIWKMLKAVFLNNSNDSYHITVNDSGHLGFTDSLYLDRSEEGLERIGNRNPLEFRELKTAYHKCFYDKYLLKMDVKITDVKFNDIKYYEKVSH